MQTTAFLERSAQPDPAHQRHGDDSNPAALEKSSQPAQTATQARRSIEATIETGLPNDGPGRVRLVQK